VREQRLVFGEDPDLYDLARPSYPAALLDDLVTMVGPSARALDVGCGTGKATVLLAARA
jgi:trans-aconitate methyltransferase